MRGVRRDDDTEALGDHALGDRALVVALRCGSTAAVREFVLRFRPMLVLASRRFGITGGDREEYADEILHDAATRFMDMSTAVPLSVRGYLLRSLRNRIANLARARGRRMRATQAATDTAGDTEPYFEQAVIGCASEYSVRASHGPMWHGPPPVASSLLRLAEALTADMTVDERLLIAWLAHHVPQQEIAAWLGLGYEATSKRIRRLRARLQIAAARHMEHLSPTDHHDVTAFLQRAGAAPPIIGAAPGSMTRRPARSTPTR